MESKELEKAFILEIIRFKDFNKVILNDLINDTIDFPWILGQLMFNRVGGIAYYVLKESELLYKLNREFRNSLKNIFEIQRIKADIFLNDLSEISGYLKNIDVKYAMLKGSYLASNLYELGLRTSNDFDILIEQKDIDILSETLKKNGFQQGKYDHINNAIINATRKEILNSRLNRGETVPFLKINDNSNNFIEVDINFSLDYKAKNDKNIVGKVLESVQTFETRRNKLCTLSQEDFLIQLCVHLYKEAAIYNWVMMQRDLSLYKFCDIYAFFYAFSLDNISLLLNKIRQYGLEKECYYSLQLTSEIYPSLKEKSNYSLLLKSLKPDNTDFLKHIFYPLNNVEYYYEMDFTDWLFTYNRVDYLKQSNGSYLKFGKDITI